MTGSVRIDLSREPKVEGDDRRKLAVLERVPDGARVLVEIGRRGHVSPDAVTWLHQHGARLAIEIVGTDPRSVLAFVTAARSGDTGVMAW